MILHLTRTFPNSLHMFFRTFLKWPDIYLYICISCMCSLKIQCPTAQPCCQSRQNKKLASKRGATSFTSMYFGYERSDMEFAKYAADRLERDSRVRLNNLFSHLHKNHHHRQSTGNMLRIVTCVTIRMWAFSLEGPSIDVCDISDSWLAHCKNYSIVVKCLLSDESRRIINRRHHSFHLTPLLYVTHRASVVGMMRVPIWD